MRKHLNKGGACISSKEDGNEGEDSKAGICKSGDTLLSFHQHIMKEW
jgi:hypothetical protein